MTLRGVNGAAATVLLKAGLGSFDALAANPSSVVLESYEKTRQAMSAVNAPPAEEALAAQWVRAARQYLGLPDASTSA